MRILHVTLSNPKTHTQGLNRYCLDLAETQAGNGDKIHILYAGSPYSIKRGIAKKKKKNGVQYWKLNRALPEPIMYGVSEPMRYRHKCDRVQFEKYLKDVHPDVIHVHSVQGVYLEFFECAHEMSIPIIYTVHDFFPMCLRCNLVDNNGQYCERIISSDVCAACNISADKNHFMQMIVQSEIYSLIKRNPLVVALKKKFLGKKVRKPEEEKQEKEPEIKSITIWEYRTLMEYYEKILSLFDVAHFNSEVTKDICMRIRRFPESYVLPITHAGIRDAQTHRRGRVLRVSYMGGYTPNKGIDVLKKALSRLPKDGWRASIYGSGTEKNEKGQIRECGEFRGKKEAENVWNSTDLLVVPSTCPETFGYVVLEAVSRGIPVICSSLTGAKCVLGPAENELTFPVGNDEILAEKIWKFTNLRYYERIQDSLIAHSHWQEIESHERDINALYRRTIQKIKYGH